MPRLMLYRMCESVAFYSSKDSEDGLTRYLGELQSIRRCYTALQTNLLLEAIASMLRSVNPVRSL